MVDLALMVHPVVLLVVLDSTVVLMRQCAPSVKPASTAEVLQPPVCPARLDSTVPRLAISGASRVPQAAPRKTQVPQATSNANATAAHISS